MTDVLSPTPKPGYTPWTVGCPVRWTSSSTVKAGVITHIVPAGSWPAKLGVKIDGGLPRDHESYIVRGKKLNYKGEPFGSAALYWPRVSLLMCEGPSPEEIAFAALQARVAALEEENVRLSGSMDVLEAMRQTVALSRPGLEHRVPSLSHSHLLDMLARMEAGSFSYGKQCRWLGWAQAAVVSIGYATLEDMKRINMGAQKSARALLDTQSVEAQS